MKTENKKIVSETRLGFLRNQGFFTQTDQELSEMAFGIRFAYKTCFTILVIGIGLANVPVLAIMMTMAFLGAVLPNHPFDYIYNYFLADSMKRPKLPRRDVRLKFACSIATLWIGATIYLFLLQNLLAGYLVGASLLIAVISVAFFDFCIPSVVFNWFSKPKIKTISQ